MHFIIFDFDGTIANSNDFIIEKMLEFVNEHGIKDVDTKKIDEYKNMPPKKLMKKFNIPLKHVPKHIMKFRKDYHKAIDSIKPFKNIDMVLKKLIESSKILGIITSNSQEIVEKYLSINNLQYFDFIESNPGIFKKDRMIKKALRKHRLGRKETIYIGDEVRDIEAAKKAKIMSGAVTWGLNGKEILKNQNPDYLFETPEDILKLI